MEEFVQLKCYYQYIESLELPICEEKIKGLL